MNQIIENILTRRSVRSFKEEQISDTDLDTILEAAKYAPSGMGKQAWHFTVVQNKEVIEKLIAVSKEALQDSPIEMFRKMAANPSFNPFYNAPTIIIVAGDKTSLTKVADGAVALENIFLAAHSLNIGSCWINLLSFIEENPKVKSLLTELGVPEDYSIVGTASIGFNSKEDTKAGPRKEGTVNIIK